MQKPDIIKNEIVMNQDDVLKAADKIIDYLENHQLRIKIALDEESASAIIQGMLSLP